MSADRFEQEARYVIVWDSHGEVRESHFFTTTRGALAYARSLDRRYGSSAFKARLVPVLAGARHPRDGQGNVVIDLMTCGTCGRSWNDADVSGITPTPSGRCPFEYDHGEVV